jgi:signal transduction histidine kinase
MPGPGGFELLVEIAHDFRSPLTSILFLAETLRRGQSGEVNDVQRRQLGIVYSAALGLISVASDMIELARGGSHLMDKEPAPFSVCGVLESVRDIVLPMAEEKGLSLRLLPPQYDQRRGYPVALSRVLLNLTTNALKFTDEGLIEITVQELPDDRVEFSVRDTGRGLDDDALNTLFQPFRRSRGRRGHSFSGSGLGLMISRRLVEAMEAELRLETRAGWGTRFFFELELPAVGEE